MSFRSLLDTSQAIALANTLQETEEAVWERYCREFSNKFATPLLEVRSMDPLFVLTQVNSYNLQGLEVEERLDDIIDMIGSLSDPEYDIKKERAIREELKKIEEEEEDRLREGRAVHPSLEKDKKVISKEQSKAKEIPKSGGINMSLINQLNNKDKEG